jgi:hypothetical protein
MKKFKRGFYILENMVLYERIWLYMEKYDHISGNFELDL